MRTSTSTTIFLKATALFLFLLNKPLLLTQASSSPTSLPPCDPSYLSDGYCDPECNNKESFYDKGDCCEDTCVDEHAEYDCGINGYDCKSHNDDNFIASTSTTSYQYTKQYSGFELTLQCDRLRKAGYAVKYAYTLTADRKDLGRKSSYQRDPTVPEDCQQQFEGSTLPSYKTKECTGQSGRQKNAFCYDRGHIVMANHMDGTDLTKQEASYVTNLTPQVAGFNQAGGSWHATEDIIECHRDFPNVAKLDVFGGLVYDDDSNDYFLETHNIPTADLFYKVVVKYFKEDDTEDEGKKDPDVIAWIMQNKVTDRAYKLDQRFDGMDEDGNFSGDLISIAQLKRLVNDRLERLPPTFSQSAYEAGESWDNPSDCSKGFATTSSRDEL